MLIKKSPPETSYGMACRTLQIPLSEAGGSECVLEPCQLSVFHRHHESEIFVIVRGRGRLDVDGRHVGDVGPGDVIFLRPFAGHALRNLSDDERLEFVALYWGGQDVHAAPAPLPDRVLIFSTPPTPNGDLHLGHLSGPYLGADIYRRYLRQKNVDAIHVTGRDDNQTYVKRIARMESRAPEAVAEDYARSIRETWAKAGIPLDFFSSPKGSVIYREQLSSMISRLLDSGMIVEKTVEELYDRNTGFSLHEGYVKGGCPHCGCSSDGNACEQCGRPNDCIDLADPVPTLPGVELGRRRLCKLYFRMSAVAPQLAELVARSNMSARARALSVAMLADGLPDICISHRSDWGMPAGVPGFEDQVIYVWFEMAAGYLAADLQASSGRPFFADPGSSIVHFYGFDNAYYHTLLFPAIYMALGGDVNVPGDHVVNELLFLRGEKFSTSRRHLIWGRKLLAHIPSDYARWGLSRVRPELRNEDFDLDRFIEQTNTFFAGRLAGWLTSTLAHLAQQYGGMIPEPGAWSQQHMAFHQEVRYLAEGAERAYQVSGFSPQAATRRLEELVERAHEFFATHCRHETGAAAKDHHRTTVALNFWAMAVFARLAMPIVPETAQRILALLGLGDQAGIDGTGGFIQRDRQLDPAMAPSLPPISSDIAEAVSCVD
ncbi:class I tRNA ligase family protein [Ramlibacter sp.]|uniref:class I tRNA ligase family protein n=1 Tax=Ramlibacter sp. TaxID=1917967 RepID=UPI0017FEF664|nr:class I tRNA ligase family protein [Ramlibacter sp.]MBA2672105.1 class I tRNA ligase family protein [Ramlibacter sp.]